MYFMTAARSVRARVCADVELKIAASRAEREEAFRLTYRSYLEAGLCEKNSTEARITDYQLLPTTEIFVAKLRGEVISTLSLVRDGELGLPLEEIYADEVAARRQAGLHAAEVSCLADRRTGLGRFFGLFCDLSRVMVQYARTVGVDQLLIAVHPRHATLYRRCMAFEPMGEPRDYPAVLGNRAVGLCLDLNVVQARRPPSWGKFFGERLPAEVLTPQPMCDEDRDYFHQIACSAKQESLLCA